jgi:putative oxidoreductase
LHHLAKITAFFTSLNIALPAFNAYFVSGLELVGGILLILGLGSRLTSFLLASDMLVAYWAADYRRAIADGVHNAMRNPQP